MDSKKCENTFENVASTSKDTSSQSRNERYKNRMKRKSSNTAEQDNKCIKKFRRVKKLHQGRITTHESDFFGECDACGKSFKRREYLIRHIKQKHNNDRDKVCVTCGKQFAIRAELNKHMKSVHSYSLTTCEICGGTYKNRSVYLCHMNNAHKPKCSCDVCGKEINQNRLKQHLLRHNSRQFICPVCGKMFYMKYDMQVHILIHTGKRYYECSFCGKSFAQWQGLYDHRKRMHTKPFPPMPTIPLDGIIEDFLKEREITMRPEK